MVAPSIWRSVGFRLFAPIAAFAILLMGLIFLVIISNYLDFSNQNRERLVASVAAAGESFMDKAIQARGFARMVARMPDLADAIDARDQRVLIDTAVPYVQFTSLQRLTIYDPGGVVLARADAPAVFGRTDALAPWLTALAGPSGPGMLTSTILPLDQRLFYLTAVPVRTLNRALGAFVVAGFPIDADFLTGLKARSGADTAVSYRGQPVASSLPAEREAMPTIQRMPVPLPAVIPAEAGFTLSVCSDGSLELARFRTRLTLLGALLTLATITVTLFSVWSTRRTVTVPLEDMTVAMMRLAEGERGVNIPHCGRLDEIGAMGRAAEVFQRAMNQAAELRVARERAEAAAKAAAETSRQLHLVIAAAPACLLLCRGDPPRVVLSNSATCDLFGASEETLRDTSLFDLIDDAERRRLEVAFQGDGSLDEVDAGCRVLSGPPRWGSFSTRRIQSGDGPALLVGVTDITRRRQSEIALRQAKDAAERTLDQLRRTQQSLIQAEKLAATSLLVAGVAHEINTPVGVALTGATYLVGKTRALRGLFDTDAMRYSDLDGYLVTATETLALVEYNVNRATELVRSFKQVAVDQTSQDRRRFDVPGYVQEVLISLGPRLRKAGHPVALLGPPALEVDNFPGALAQILTNLVINATVHAFEPGQTGRIAIEIADAGDAVTLTCADNGKGIPVAHVDRVFDAFFTTRRGSGGTGLGLHITYHLATTVMGGSIAVISEPGQGTVFTLNFPKVAPEHAPGGGGDGREDLAT